MLYYYILLRFCQPSRVPPRVLHAGGRRGHHRRRGRGQARLQVQDRARPRRRLQLQDLHAEGLPGGLRHQERDQGADDAGGKEFLCTRSRLELTEEIRRRNNHYFVTLVTTAHYIVIMRKLRLSTLQLLIKLLSTSTFTFSFTSLTLFVPGTCFEACFYAAEWRADKTVTKKTVPHI